MQPFNKLSPEQAERLALLLEELGEAQQAIGKILRHGYDSFNPDCVGSKSNRTDLLKELAHVKVAFSLMLHAGDFEEPYYYRTDFDAVCEEFWRMQKNKAHGVKRYLHHTDFSGSFLEEYGIPEGK